MLSLLFLLFWNSGTVSKYFSIIVCVVVIHILAVRAPLNRTKNLTGHAPIIHFFTIIISKMFLFKTWGSGALQA